MILSTIESNFTNDPVYFNYFSKFLMNLNDSYILLNLALNIKIKNMICGKKTQTLTIIYKIYYNQSIIQYNLTILFIYLLIILLFGILLLVNRYY